MLATTCILTLMTTAVEVPVKHVSAPPADLARGWLREADPREHGTASHHAVHETTFVTDTVIMTIEVPGGEQLKLLPAGTGSDSWAIEATSPGGHVFSGDGPRWKLHRGTMMPQGHSPAQRLDISGPETGTWTVRITGGEPGQPMALLVEDGSELHLRAWLDDYANHVGGVVTINVGCSLREDVHSNGNIAMSRATVHGASIHSLSARVEHEDGTMHQLASRGTQLQLGTTAAGIEVVIIDAMLNDGHGGLLHRTATLPIAIEDDVPVLTGRVDASVIAPTHAGINLELAAGTTRTRVLAGAEVWGTDDRGHAPRCWIGGITPLDASSMQLVLDTRWLHGCDPTTIELRSVRLADVDTFVPLARLPQVPLPTLDIPADPPSSSDAAAMRMGTPSTSRTISVDLPPTPPAAPTSRMASTGGHNLMLCHGYCSDGQSWPPSHFSGEVSLYMNTEQNFTHDQFALDILSFGSQYKSYSVVGHSQGGNAGLHLYSFYWSGIDWATGARKVQVLGTPLQGTILAGSIADLGEIFGIQCGSNYDMTYDGAAQWISFLPGWARAETWAWSTTFEDGWFYDYCHLASDIILWDPEDGVVEVFAAHLDGTNDMGMEEGWCHIQDMADPAQVYDTSRNDEINSEAAR